MIAKDKALEIVNKVLAYSKADMTEAVLENSRLSLSRFAESRITDNIDTEESTLYIRQVKDKRLGIITTGDLSDEGIRHAVISGESALRFMEADEKFESLPGPYDVQLKEDHLVEGTANFGPQNRAEAISLIKRISSKGGAEASGAFRMEEDTLAVANSLGVERYHSRNYGYLTLTVSGRENNSGWAMEFNRDVSKIDVNAIAKRALDKAMRSRDPISLPDGKYTVILEPAAVGQLLLMLSFMGFGCKSYYQHMSFMAGKLGEKIAGENFTVYDDPTDPDFNFRPFDYEGIPGQKTELITEGVAKGMVCNSYYSNLLEREPTGHALPANNAYGAYPKTLVIPAGDNSIEAMIKNTERGVYITHFWYVNFLNPMRTMITGTTVDGTFLIENGSVTRPVRTMRTNQSLLEAFSNIETISKDRIVYPQFSVLLKVPGMKIENFNLAAEEEEDSKC